MSYHNKLAGLVAGEAKALARRLGGNYATPVERVRIMRRLEEAFELLRPSPRWSSTVVQDQISDALDRGARLLASPAFAAKPDPFAAAVDDVCAHIRNALCDRDAPLETRDREPSPETVAATLRVWGRRRGRPSPAARGSRAAALLALWLELGISNAETAEAATRYLERRAARRKTPTRDLNPVGF